MPQLDKITHTLAGAAMRLALDCGVAINAAYRFLDHANRHPS